MSTIGFSGTREGMTDRQKRAFHLYLFDWNRNWGVSEFHSGDCVGADKEAHDIAKAMGIRTVGHPPINPKLRAYCDFDETREPKEYLPRNLDIIRESDLVIATPKETEPQERGSGTWHVIRNAPKLNTSIVIIWPDGSTEKREC